MQDALGSLPGWLASVALLAAVASAATAGSLFLPGPWYQALRKPAWTPPNRVFPVAWTLLYAMMALAAWLVADSGAPDAVPALALWCWQLVLNAVWSPVFFGLRRIRAGLVVIAVVWLALALTTWAFFQVSTTAGLLLLPYLAWVSYATALNLAIWRLNQPSP
jgi:tryptophan-rich sensory protein